MYQANLVSYTSFNSKISEFFKPGEQNDKMINNLLKLFNRACQIEVTTDNSTVRNLKAVFTDGNQAFHSPFQERLHTSLMSQQAQPSSDVYNFYHDFRLDFLNNKSEIFVDTVIFKTLFIRYSECEGANISDRSLFKLMLEEGEDWYTEAINKQKLASANADKRYDTLILTSLPSLVVFIFLGYLTYTGFYGCALVNLMLTLYAINERFFAFN